MESSSPPILGLDNVRLDLPIARVGSRVAAGLIDYALLTGLGLAWWLLGFLIVAWLDRTGWFWAIVGLGTFALQWGYFAILEVVMGGQTPGKLIVGLRAVSRRGGRASAVSLVVRSLLRTVDLMIAIPLMAIDPHGRRLGDHLAGTMVVHTGAPADEELRIGRLPDGWQGREVAVVEGFLRRAPHMDPDRAQELAARILALVERDDPALAAHITPFDDQVLSLVDVLQVRTA